MSGKCLSQSMPTIDRYDGMASASKITLPWSTQIHGLVLVHDEK